MFNIPLENIISAFYYTNTKERDINDLDIFLEIESEIALADLLLNDIVTIKDRFESLHDKEYIQIYYKNNIITFNDIDKLWLAWKNNNIESYQLINNIQDEIKLFFTKKKDSYVSNDMDLNTIYNKIKNNYNNNYVLGYMILEDLIFINSRWMYTDDKEDVVILLNTSDVFAWGYADAIELRFIDINDIWNSYLENNEYGTIVWACLHQTMLPQKSVYDKMIQNGIDLTKFSLKENSYDRIKI